MRYTATIRHHSIARARTISAATLAAAKRAATREFRDEQQDYTIVIIDAETDMIVSRRILADKRWTDAQ